MEPDSRHLYAYGAGEPVGRWDPDGKSWRRRLRVGRVNAALGEVILCTGNTFGGRNGRNVWAQGFTACSDNFGFANADQIQVETIVSECWMEIFGNCLWWHEVNSVEVVDPTPWP